MGPLLAALLAIAAPGAQTPPTDAVEAPSPFTFEEVMVPMRDGARLQTVIVRPKDRAGPLPILLQCTPYGVPDAPLPAGLPRATGRWSTTAISSSSSRCADDSSPTACSRCRPRSTPGTATRPTTGRLAATLMASTGGTDSDFVVKLIDVLPDDVAA